MDTYVDSAGTIAPAIAPIDAHPQDGVPVMGPYFILVIPRSPHSVPRELHGAAPRFRGRLLGHVPDALVKGIQLVLRIGWDRETLRPDVDVRTDAVVCHALFRALFEIDNALANCVFHSSAFSRLGEATRARSGRVVAPTVARV
jgi:hypothetical protein